MEVGLKKATLAATCTDMDGTEENVEALFQMRTCAV